MKESARLSAVTIPFKVTDDSSLGANRFIVPLCSSLSSDSRNSHQGVCILGHAWLVPMGMWRGWWLRRCAFPCPARAIFCLCHGWSIDVYARYCQRQRAHTRVENSFTTRLCVPSWHAYMCMFVCMRDSFRMHLLNCI